MDYFSDLTFENYGSCRKSNSVAHCRYFEGYYGLQFIRSGEIFVDCEGNPSWQSRGPLVFFTAPDKLFSYGTPNGTRHHLWCCFRGERVQRYLTGGLLPQNPGSRIPIIKVDEFTAVMENLLRMIRCKTPAAHAEAVLLLEKALVMVNNQPQAPQMGRFNRELIRELAEKIAEHPEKEWDFKCEAAAFKLSEVHFRRLFFQETGVAPRQYVLEHRIRHAAGLLQSTGMLIKEIAFECGFGGEFYFSRQFCRIMKQSPSEFRKNGNFTQYKGNRNVKTN